MLSRLDNEALTKILLMQNMLGQLPDEKSIFEFACRGIFYLPGVSDARFTRDGEVSPLADVADAKEYAVAIHKSHFGSITLTLDDADAFEPYDAYIANLCFMMAAVMEQHQRSALEKTQQEELERRVTERTKQLALQVVETQAAMHLASLEKERAQRYLDVSEAIIVELNRAGEVAVINARGVALLGWRLDELVGKNWFDVVISADIREKMKDLFRKSIEGNIESAEYYENELVCRDGSKRFVAWHNVLRRDVDGKIIRVLSSGIDITKRKLTALALQAEKELLAVTMRCIGDGVIATDNDKTILLLNRTAETLTGWRFEQAVGRPLSEVYNAIPEGTLGESEGNSDPQRPGRRVRRQRLVSLDGQEILVSQLRSPMHDKNSRKVGDVLVFRDITREQDLRDRLERAARLDSIGLLAGGIAHDFNNLLGGLFGFLELAGSTDDIDEVRKYLNKSNSVFERARHLTGQLLTFAKGGAPVLKVGDVAEVVRDATSFALSGSNIGCTYEIEENLGAVAFDAHQLSQVVDNIVINAKQAMVNSGRLNISIGNTVLAEDEHPTLDAGKYVKISIRDFGIGIPQSLIHRIFDPFLTTKQNGSGLGLATAYSIIEKHGGVIDVESEPNEGTTFHILLPTSSQAQGATAKSDNVVHLGKGTALVLDDEDFVREIFSAMLRSMGYEVVCFNDGSEVVTYLKELKGALPRPVVALFDLTIPGGSGGTEIVDAVRKWVDEIVIFAVSGYADGPVMANPKEHGFTDSLAKPFRKKDLSALLEKHLSSKM